VKLRTILALTISAAIPIQTLAQPHVIAQLGNAPLVAQIASTTQLQNDVARDSALYRAAGDRLGLTPHEYALFAQRIAAKQVSYVTVPRHLDAMTWASGGNVYALHDVVIPANTMGWEVDLQEGHQVLALFVPARCGNLSVLRRTLPVLAQAGRQHHKPMVEAAATAPPVAPAAPIAQAPAVGLPAPPPVQTAPVQSVASSTPAVTHRGGFWPLLLIPVVALLTGGHGSNSTPTIPIFGGPPPGGASGPPPGFGGGPPPRTGPTPPPGGCPSPVPASRF
jgi:hypothetical protein